MIFVLAGAKPVSMRYDPALMSIGCPSMRWFLGHFLCRLVPVRRLAADVYTVAFGSVLVGLRQWNHHWFDTVLGGLPWTSSSCVDPVDRWSELQWLELVRTYIELRSIRLLLLKWTSCMRWFLGLFLMKACSRPAFGCRRLYCGIFGSVLFGLRQWNHLWFDIVLGGLPWTSSSCVSPVDRWSELQWL